MNSSQTGQNKHESIIIQEKSSNGNIIRYSKGKFLGKGGFAKCYQLTSLQNDKKYAVKVIEKSTLTRSKAKEKLNSQINIHRSLKSPYIVGFHHYFDDQNNVYIILELCSNQTLNQLIKRRKRITQIQAKYYIYQIAMGLKDIHSNQVIHRDLKLGNLFLTQKLQVKIGDFGLAAKLAFDSERRKTMCGTPNYIAPQILQNQGGHSYEVDVWSLGVIAYAFVVGRPPFQTNDVKTTYNKIKNCNYSFPDSINLSLTTKKFISKMLMKQPFRRATIDQILNDSFFTQMPFPKSLPAALVACPPAATFIKQYSQNQITKSTLQSQGTSTSRERLQRKQSQQYLNTDRRSSKQKDSLGRVLVRASSNDKMEHKNQGFQRASSTYALNIHKKQHIQKQMIVPRASNAQSPILCVSHFEQNAKFGICYILNSNATCMRFNDSTFLVSNSAFSQVKYYGNLRQNVNGQLYQIGKTPESLNKKMKIISHYHKQLKSRKQSSEAALTNDQRIYKQKFKYKQTPQTSMNYFVVRKYQNQKVKIFWFNNKDYQAIFMDLTQILVSKDKYAAFINKMGQRKQFVLNDINDHTDDIKKRMSYVLTLIQGIRTRESAQRNIQNESNKQNKQNVPQLIRSSSVMKMQKINPTLQKSSSTASRLTSMRPK